MPRPSFFVVGAPKCGTTSLCHYLGQHPEIFIPDVKELQFFAADLDISRPVETRDGYLDCFASTAKPHTGEGTPWYLYSTTAAREIRDFNRDAKIIISIRNPTEMVYSLFRYRRYTGIEKSKSFSGVLAREDQYISSIESGSVIEANNIYYRAAMYYDQIGRYIETFGSSKVHIVIFEDLKNNPEKVYRGILQFLGVSDDFRPTFRNVNKTGQIRSERFQERIAHLPGPVKRLAYAFPRGVRRPAYRALHRLNTSYAPPPPLDPTLRRRLNDRFRPDVERLSALLGRDLTHWLAE